MTAMVGAYLLSNDSHHIHYAYPAYVNGVIYTGGGLLIVWPRLMFVCDLRDVHLPEFILHNLRRRHSRLSKMVQRWTAFIFRTVKLLNMLIFKANLFSR